MKIKVKHIVYVILVLLNIFIALNMGMYDVIEANPFTILAILIGMIDVSAFFYLIIENWNEKLF